MKYFETFAGVGGIGLGLPKEWECVGVSEWDKYASMVLRYHKPMKKYPKHYSPEPNEWVPHKIKMQWQCCDCGLVHNVDFRLNLLDVKMTRNFKETKKVRSSPEITPKLR